MPNIHTQGCTNHLYTLAGRRIVLLKPAHLLAPTEDTDMHRNYEEAYACYAPIFRRQWGAANVTLATCKRAMADIYDSLKLHPERTPYSGKLWAELDAVRERIAKLQPR